MDTLKRAAEAMGEVEHWDYSAYLKPLPPLEPVQLRLTDSEFCDQQCSLVATEEDCEACNLNV